MSFPKSLLVLVEQSNGKLLRVVHGKSQIRWLYNMSNQSSGQNLWLNPDLLIPKKLTTNINQTWVDIYGQYSKCQTLVEATKATAIYNLEHTQVCLDWNTSWDFKLLPIKFMATKFKWDIKGDSKVLTWQMITTIQERNKWNIIYYFLWKRTKLYNITITLNIIYEQFYTNAI